MKHVGSILKQQIYEKRLVQRRLAEEIGITPAYLSSLLAKSSIDCSLLERICRALEISPMTFFDYDPGALSNHNEANTVIGNSTVNVVSANTADLEKIIIEKDRLLAEKERTIQILLGAYKTPVTGTETEHL